MQVVLAGKEVGDCFIVGVNTMQGKVSTCSLIAYWRPPAALHANAKLGKTSPSKLIRRSRLELQAVQERKHGTVTVTRRAGLGGPQYDS